MLEKNLLYIYDHKLEHNGPYKDLVKAELKALTGDLAEALVFSKTARGIYKIESSEVKKMIAVEFLINNQKKVIKVKHEP